MELLPARGADDLLHVTACPFVSADTPAPEVEIRETETQS
jgi:hypothetical protein